MHLLLANQVREYCQIGAAVSVQGVRTELCPKTVASLPIFGVETVPEVTIPWDWRTFKVVGITSWNGETD